MHRQKARSDDVRDRDDGDRDDGGRDHDDGHGHDGDDVRGHDRDDTWYSSFLFQSNGNVFGVIILQNRGIVIPPQWFFQVGFFFRCQTQSGGGTTHLPQTLYRD